MNQTLINNNKTILLDLLKQCTEPQQFMFKRMYSHKNLDASIEEAVENMAENKIDWAVTQVEKTLNKS